MIQQLHGHEIQQQMFLRALQRGRLGHAYLFSGPRGIGKRTFAEFLARRLLCQQAAAESLTPCDECPGCRQVLSGTHPDLFRIALPEGKSELPIEVFVGTTEKRGRSGLCHDLSLTPMHGGYRIALIDDADKMNVASANALLKTLEEPGPNSLLFLIATDADQVINTIRSRCQLIYFNPLSDHELELCLDDYCSRAGLETPAGAVRQTVITEAAGSAGRAIAKLEQVASGSASPLAGLEKLLQSGRSTALETMREAESFLKQAGSDTGTQRAAAQQIVDLCLAFFHKILLEPTLNDASAADRFADAMDRCLEAHTQLERKANVTGCLDHFFQDLEMISRRAFNQTSQRA